SATSGARMAARVHTSIVWPRRQSRTLTQPMTYRTNGTNRPRIPRTTWLFWNVLTRTMTAHARHVKTRMPARRKAPPTSMGKTSTGVSLGEGMGWAGRRGPEQRSYPKGERLQPDSRRGETVGADVFPVSSPDGELHC